MPKNIKHPARMMIQGEPAVIKTILTHLRESLILMEDDDIYNEDGTLRMLPNRNGSYRFYFTVKDIKKEPK